MTLYRSTRGGPTVDFGQAVLQGLALDGGLYVPQDLPRIDRSFLRELQGRTFAEVATDVGRILMGGAFEDRLEEIVHDAFPFDVPLRTLHDNVYVLELFHGPTMAFKDVGARFLARVLPLLSDSSAPITVLTATSGDTGAAVAAAFHGVSDVEVVIVYPKGGVSPYQERQFASLGGNVKAVCVEGSFDDCQSLVKDAFLDEMVRDGLGLTSANSINIGRLLPQIFYYFRAWAQLPEDDGELVVSVPSGNFGNLTAGLIAQRMGLPISRFVASTNENDVVPRYLETGFVKTGPSVATISNAMDVGDPSNLERLHWLFDGRGVEGMRELVTGHSFSDDQTRSAIRDVFASTGQVLCPHTAVGYLGLMETLDAMTGSAPMGMTLATAHPAKFPEVVEPLVGFPPEAPGSAQHPPDTAPSFVLCGTEYADFRQCLLVS